MIAPNAAPIIPVKVLSTAIEPPSPCGGRNIQPAMMAKKPSDTTIARKFWIEKTPFSGGFGGFGGRRGVRGSRTGPTS